LQILQTECTKGGGAHRVHQGRVFLTETFEQSRIVGIGINTNALLARLLTGSGNYRLQLVVLQRYLALCFFRSDARCDSPRRADHGLHPALQLFQFAFLPVHSTSATINDAGCGMACESMWTGSVSVFTFCAAGRFSSMY